MSNPHETVFQNQQKLSAQILDVLVQLAQKAGGLEPHQTNIGTFNDLQTLLPMEHRDEFNADMERCIRMRSIHEFTMTDEAIATNVLPHFANFLGSLIVANLINYRASGCPVKMTIEVDSRKLATATIEWAYSIVGADEVNVPERREGDNHVQFQPGHA